MYPKGIHGCIADFLKDAGMEVRTATLKEPEHGLTQEVLDNTDVLIWWGHMAHHQVADEIVDRVHKRIQEGMGLIVLHSGHASKIFQRICGTNSGMLKWREDGEKEILWVVDPSHPIADGLDEKIIIPHEEMYDEHFNIPSRMSWCSSAGSRAARCSAAGAATIGQGQDFYSARPRGVPHLPPAGDPACDHQRGEVGRAGPVPAGTLWKPASCGGGSREAGAQHCRVA